MRVVHCQWLADINPATVSPECLASSLAFPVKLLLRYGKTGEGLVPFLHNWQMVKIFRTKKRLFLHIVQPTTHFQHLVCVWRGHPCWLDTCDKLPATTFTLLAVLGHTIPIHNYVFSTPFHPLTLRTCRKTHLALPAFTIHILWLCFQFSRTAFVCGRSFVYLGW